MSAAHTKAPRRRRNRLRAALPELAFHAFLVVMLIWNFS